MDTLSNNIDGLLDIATRVITVVFAIYVVLLFLQTLFRSGPVVAIIRLFSTRVLVPLLGVITLWTLSAALVFIQPPTLGVVISVASPGGVRPSALNAGLHWIIPLLEEVQVYPIYWQTYTMSNNLGEGDVVANDAIRARTSDGQEVYLDISIIFRIDSGQAVQVHIDWQDRYIEDFVRPVIRGYVRTEVSQFTVEEVNSSARRDLEQTLDSLLQAEFANKGFTLDQFLLRDVTFSDEYAAAIEAKQVALEDQERALYEAETERRLARGIADAVRIEAEGQADAIVLESQGRSDGFRLIGETLSQNPALIQYYYVERLAPNINAALLPNNAAFILPLDNVLQTPAPVSTTPSDGQATPMPTPQASDSNNN